MSSARFIIGLTIFGLGVFLLLDNFQLLVVDWGYVSQFWPVLLIVWGLSLLARQPGRQYLLALVGFIGLVYLLSFGNQQHWFGNLERTPIVVSDTLSAAYETGTMEASLDLTLGAGTFNIAGTTTDLVRGDTLTSLGRFTLTQTGTAVRPNVYISQATKLHHWNPTFWRNQKNWLQLSLNPNPVWTISADTGAAKADFDLSQYKVKQISVDTGATDLIVTLGKRQPEVITNISAGASKIILRVPSSSGVEIQVNAGASSKDFVGLVQIEPDQLWRSTNFDTATEKLLISIDAGASSLHLEQY